MKFIQYIIYSILIVFLLGPFFAFFSTKFLDRNFLYLLAGVIYLVTTVKILEIITGSGKVIIPKYLKFYGLFVLYTVLSDIFIVGKSIDFKYFYSSDYIASLSLLFLVENIEITSAFKETCKKIFLFVVTIALFVIIMQELVNPYFFADPSFYSMWPGMSRDELQLPSIFAWVEGVTVNISFLAMLSLLLGEYIPLHNKVKIFNLYFWGGIFAFLSKGRSIMINFLLLFFMNFMTGGITEKFKKIMVWALILLIVSVSTVAVLKSLNVPVDEIVMNRILEENAGGLGSGASESRILSFFVFAELFPEHPVFGKGEFHTFGEVSGDFELQTLLVGKSSQIHVGYLSLLYYYGIVGGLLYFLFAYFLMKDFYNVAKKTSRWGPFFVFVGFLFINFTLVYLPLYDIGLIMAFVFHNYYKKESEGSGGDMDNGEKNLVYANS
ncbi:MAG: O-antigen ligase family protein [Ignavibacteriaceae bacterium]|nr:O-antigen ligase family protein [Ignavibacteriaceae bacterium]